MDNFFYDIDFSWDYLVASGFISELRRLTNGWWRRSSNNHTHLIIEDLNRVISNFVWNHDRIFDGQYDGRIFLNNKNTKWADPFWTPLQPDTRGIHQKRLFESQPMVYWKCDRVDHSRHQVWTCLTTDWNFKRFWSKYPSHIINYPEEISYSFCSVLVHPSQCNMFGECEDIVSEDYETDGHSHGPQTQAFLYFSDTLKDDPSMKSLYAIKYCQALKHFMESIPFAYHNEARIQHGFEFGYNELIELDNGAKITL